jgi:hypothetical protein
MSRDSTIASQLRLNDSTLPVLVSHRVDAKATSNTIIDSSSISEGGFSAHQNTEDRDIPHATVNSSVVHSI